MGSVESCSACTTCKGVPLASRQSLGKQAYATAAAKPALRDPDGCSHLTCFDTCHVQALIASLPDTQQELLGSAHFHERCTEAFRRLDQDATGYLEGQELLDAVQEAVPSRFLDRRLHLTDTASVVQAFDEDSDGRISLGEFEVFCQWVIAMEYHGFFEGTAPLAQIAEIGPGQGAATADRLLIVSEFLDPERKLRECAKPCVRCVYYHPDGLTLDEFSAQLESAAYIRSRRGETFQSVALANHGPDEDGLWRVCADRPVPLSSSSAAWAQLMPLFHALADMVEGPGGGGHVDILACNFAATPGGMDCITMIEQEANARFAASTDATGNVAEGGNWELEVGGRSVAPIYFDERKLAEFHKLMRPAERRHREPKHGGARTGRGRERSSKVIAQQLGREMDAEYAESLLNVDGAVGAVIGGLQGAEHVVANRARRASVAVDGAITEVENFFQPKESARKAYVAPASTKGRKQGRFRQQAAPMPQQRRVSISLLADADPRRFDQRCL